MATETPQAGSPVMVLLILTVGDSSFNQYCHAMTQGITWRFHLLNTQNGHQQALWPVSGKQHLARMAEPRV
jgi:hypothetical protein